MKDWTVPPVRFRSVLLAENLDRMSHEELLDTRFCDLPLRIEGTPLEPRIARLYEELHAQGLRFRPRFWLSEEWFTPDDIPGFAITFYLAHPRLSRLERKQMLEVEGGTEKECLRFLRHEAGHAIDNAFYLHRRQGYRELFGRFGRRYPRWYKPEPNSREYVHHLPAWYAQAHPAEDFAETFAVWLTPGSRWRSGYEGWPALRKLEYVDDLMRELAGKVPINKSRATVGALPELSDTLREHYHRKREHYAFKWPPDYDRGLLQIFSSDPRLKSCPSAVGFLRRHRRELCREVAQGTGVHSYAIDQMYAHMMARCRELQLRVGLTEDHARERLLILLTGQTINGVRSGYHRIAL
jgi:hypothetical protein